MFDTVEETVLTKYITRLDCVEIESIPEDVFAIKETRETIDGVLVDVKLLRNNDNHFLLIEKDDYPKFLIKKEQCLLELLTSIEILNIGIKEI